MNFFASFMSLVRVFAFGLAPLYTVGVISISRYFRVAKGFSLKRDGTQINSVVRDLAQISRVMRDSLLFSQGVMDGFPLKFPCWLIPLETRSREIKNI